MPTESDMQVEISVLGNEMIRDESTRKIICTNRDEGLVIGNGYDEAVLSRGAARELAEHLISYADTGSLQLSSVSLQNGTG